MGLTVTKIKIIYEVPDGDECGIAVCGTYITCQLLDYHRKCVGFDRPIKHNKKCQQCLNAEIKENNHDENKIV